MDMMEKNLSIFFLEGVENTGEELGRGAFATVTLLSYRGLPCAGKRLHDAFNSAGGSNSAPASGDLFLRFRTECFLLSQLRHPNIVQFLGIYFEEGMPVLVTELLQTTLAKCLDRHGVFPEEVGHTVLRDVALGLVYLHKYSPPIVHRDLSANNILLTEGMTAKIADLGVAKMLNLSPMSQAPGTLSYMPPEALVANPDYDTKMDVFSFGVLLVHMLCGRWPIPTRVAVDPRTSKAISELERRREYFSEISQEHPLREVIHRCLNNNPVARPNATEILRSVKTAADAHPPTHACKLDLLAHLKASTCERESLQDDVHRLRSDLLHQHTQHQATNTELAAARVSHMAEVEKMSLQRDALMAELDGLKIGLSTSKKVMDKLKQQFQYEKKVQTELLEKRLKSCEDKLRVEMEATVDELNKKIRDLQMKLIAKENQRRAELDEKVKEMEDNLSRKDREVAVKLQTMALETSESVAKCQRDANALEKELAIKATTLESQQSLLIIKERTIQRLSDQLGKMQDFLTRCSPGGMSFFHPRAELQWKEYDVPVPIKLPRAIVAGSKLYIAGFVVQGTREEYRICSLDIFLREWEWLPLTPVESCGLARLSGKLVTVGGASRDGRSVTDVYCYCHERKKWDDLPPLNSARSYPVCVSAEDKIVACGGKSGQGSFDRTTEVYSREGKQWTVVFGCTLPGEWNLFWTGVFLQNTAVFLGGQSRITRSQSEPELSKDVFCLSLPTGRSSPERSRAMVEWQRMKCVPHMGALAVTLGGCLLAIGGVKQLKSKRQVHEKESKMMHLYIPQTESWIHIGDMPVPLGSPLDTVAGVSATEMFCLSEGRVFKCTLELSE